MRPCLLFLMVSTSPAYADLEPGNWEISASTELKGIREPMQTTQTRCLTEEDARDPGRIFGGTPGARCQFTNRNDTGSVFTFELACGGQPEVRGSGIVRYAPHSLEGELELSSAQITARSRISGRRLGGCQR